MSPDLKFYSTLPRSLTLVPCPLSPSPFPFPWLSRWASGPAASTQACASLGALHGRAFRSEHLSPCTYLLRKTAADPSGRVSLTPSWVHLCLTWIVTGLLCVRLLPLLFISLLLLEGKLRGRGRCLLMYLYLCIGWQSTDSPKLCGVVFEGLVSSAHIYYFRGSRCRAR